MPNLEILLDRWYLGIVLVGFGLLLALRSERLRNLRRYFRCGELTPRVEAAIERRERLEALPNAVWWLPGLVNILSGVAVLAGAVQGVIGYGFGACVFALSLGVAFLGMRNRGVTRAAPLQPRTLTSIIPAFWYPVAAGIALAPLTYAASAEFRLASIFVSVAAIVTLTVAAAMYRMPSLMSGEDPVAELMVDERLRRSRIKGLFAVGLGISFVFMAMCMPFVPKTLLDIFAYLLVLVGWCGFFIPLLLRRRVGGSMS